MIRSLVHANGPASGCLLYYSLYSNSQFLLNTFLHVRSLDTTLGQSIPTCLVQAGCTSPSLDSLARSCQWSCIRLPPSLLIIFKRSVLTQHISTRKAFRHNPRSINTYLLGSSRVHESLVRFARSFMPMVLHQAASFTTHYIQTINSCSSPAVCLDPAVLS